MSHFEIITNSMPETLTLGGKIASLLKRGDIVCLFGDLGSGKTTLVKGMAKKLGIRPTLVTSPTFVLLNIYEGKLPIYHFDLYRLEDVREILAVGYEEYVYAQGVAVIEWAQRLKGLIPSEYLEIELIHKEENQRRIKISARGKKYDPLIGNLKK